MRAIGSFTLTSPFALASGVGAILLFAMPASAVQPGAMPPHLGDSAISGAPSPETVPGTPDLGTSGSSGGGALGNGLGDSDGVVRPPAGIDPGLTQTPPKVDPRSTPVIPPSSAPGTAK